MAFDTVHNYYEHLVFEEIQDNYFDKGLASEELADLACIALNHLPPRYIRHDIDMSFYLSGQEWNEMHQRIRQVVADAYQTLMAKASTK